MAPTATRISACAACCLWLVACIAAEPVVGDQVRAAVLWVGDGDSLRARIAGRERDLRLWGIDAPEKDQPGADAARDALRDLAAGRILTAEVVAVDDYDRLVVRLHRPGGAELNLALLAAGHAWWYRRYAGGHQPYAEAERRARAARRGLWAGPAPEAPWDYRERTRE